MPQPGSTPGPGRSAWPPHEQPTRRPGRRAAPAPQQPPARRGRPVRPNTLGRLGATQPGVCRLIHQAATVPSQEKNPAVWVRRWVTAPESHCSSCRLRRVPARVRRRAGLAGIRFVLSRNPGLRRLPHVRRGSLAYGAAVGFSSSGAGGLFAALGASAGGDRPDHNPASGELALELCEHRRMVQSDVGPWRLPVSSSANACSRVALRATKTKLISRRASCRANCSPMPPLAPVTSAVEPASR